VSQLPNLRQLRLERGLSQPALAKELGMAERTVIRWENGQSSPVLKDLISLAKFFEVSVAFLIGETNQRRF